MKGKTSTSFDHHFWYFERFKGPRIFDIRDAELVNNRFTLEELKWELHIAELEESTSKAFCEWAREDYWNQYKGLIEYLYYGSLLLRQLDESGTRKARSGYSIQEVKRANDIVETIGAFVKLKKIGNRYEGCCPFHDEHGPSFNVYTDTQRWHCFGCGKNGDVIDFVKGIKGLDTAGAIKELSRRCV